MTKYKILVLIYLVSVVASALANLLQLNIQIIYRVPSLNIRWIDLAILYIIGYYFYNLFFKKEDVRTNLLVVPLCFIYIVFELFQLLSSWQIIDTPTQISLFFATLSFFIIIDLATFHIDKEEIILFIKQISIWGSVAMIISNFYLFYAFLKGEVVYEDAGIRVALDITGDKESVTTSVLTPFVYGFGLYFIQKKVRIWERIIYVAAILSIYVSLVTSFHRGSLVMILVLSTFIILSSRKAQQAFTKILAFGLLLGVGYFLFGNLLREKGYDPIEKITQTAEFAADVKNPNWDKGRSYSQEFAMAAWKRHTWTGVGYDGLYNYGLPEDTATAHNGIITSLFHRGVIGTALLILILIILYTYPLRLWKDLRNEEDETRDMMRILIVVAVLWLIPFFTQEVMWEKYGLTMQFLYFGLIANFYRQRIK